MSVQLERILARPPLVSSPSLSRLLRFLVEETLAGRGAEINEYNLGIRVFNRAAGFNPRTDPIVRVQTHHLRARLAQYYAAAGKDDPVVIELPPRKYMPQFPQEPQPAAPSEPPAPAPPEPPVLAPPEPPAPAPRWIVRGVVVASVVMLLVAVAEMGLPGPSGQGRGKHHDPDWVALNFYTRGRYLLDRQTESALRQSAECFRQSTTRDPQFAAAFAGLADALNMLVQYGYMPPRDGMEEARRAAQHAVGLDSRLAQGYVSLAAIAEAYDWDFKKAESQYRRAIQLNPELPAAHLWYGMFLRDQGRLQEAMPELRRAGELEPLSGLASINLAYALLMAGDSGAALEMARRAAELDPQFPVADVLLANLYRQRSDIGNADATLARALTLATGDAHALSVLACAYARLGRRAESAGLFRQMQQLAAERYVSPFDLAKVALMLGDEERAVTWFEEAYRQRSSGMVILRNEHAGSIKDSPRLQALIQKMGHG